MSGTPTNGSWAARVAGGDWVRITDEINEYGGALLPRLLTDEETVEIRTMYADDSRFRSTVNMGRHRFGEGEYRYFRTPYPEPIEQLKQALYPRLLPIARDWYRKLGRPAPWPDTLDEWLDMCHEAGQTKSSAILLKYREKDWNALHRDLYGDLVFPMQVVINLNQPGIDHTGGEFLLLEQRPPGTVPGHGHPAAVRTRLPVHHQRPAGRVPARLVRRAGAARSISDSFRRTAHARAGIPRRGLSMSETNNPRWAPKTFRLLGADRRPYPSTTPGAFGGHRRSRIYGRLDCPAALRSIAGGGYVRHRVFFADETTAIAAGYRPCGTCLPDKYRAWKSRDVGRHGLPRLALAAVPIPPAGHRRERQSSPRLPGLVAATGDPRAGDDYAPDTALLNFYEEHARLGMHHDKEELSHARP